MKSVSEKEITQEWCEGGSLSSMIQDTWQCSCGSSSAKKGIAYYKKNKNKTCIKSAVQDNLLHSIYAEKTAICTI